MYFLNGGVGTLEALRKPLVVNRATFERAKANCAFQPMADRLDPARKPVWFRTKQELYVPYWTLPEYQERMQRDPMAAKSDLLYQPYWMTNKSRARLVQRPSLQIKPRSEVLVHLGTDEDDGLGKGFNPLKTIKKVVKKIAKPTVLLNIATGGMYSVAKAGIDVAKGRPIISSLKTALVNLGPAGAPLTAIVGENKSLAIQAAVAGGALTAAAGAGALTPLAGKVAPVALSMGVKTLATPTPVPDTPPVSYDGGAGPVPQPQYWGSEPFGPPLGPDGRVAQAGMFGDLSPLTIGLLIGIPLVFTLLTRQTGRR